MRPEANMNYVSRAHYCDLKACRLAGKCQSIGTQSPPCCPFRKDESGVYTCRRPECFGECGYPDRCAEMAKTDPLIETPNVQISLIETRETTHGPYRKTAAVAQSLKGNIRACTNWATLPAQQKEALEMIMHKVARILEGKSTHADHWADIAGYAELGKKATYSE